MAHKRKIFIAIDSLGNGGAEKSLVSMLLLIDYTKYDVDLLLLGRGGLNEKFVPAEVNILPEPNQTLRSAFARLNARLRLLLFSISIRIKRVSNINDWGMRYWTLVASHFAPQPRHYDVAIGYGQRIPTWYVLTKVNAPKKYCWQNATFHHTEKEKRYFGRFFRQFDGVVCVSDTTKSNFDEQYPELNDRLLIIYDIINPDFIRRLSREDCSIHRRQGVTNLLTAARLNFREKGYDIMLEVARILHQRGVNYRWYILGQGEKRQEMEKFIADNRLQNNVFLLGAVANPYPYFANSDIYVQTSRFEGFGLSIAEARLLNIPVVTTGYDSVYDQMVKGRNGLVTSYEPEEIADAIERLITDNALCDNIVDYLRQEKKGNVEEFDKIRKMLDS